MSPQPGFNTTIQTMDTAAARVDDVKTDIDNLLRRVSGSVEQLGGSVWRGAASTRFQAIMAEWQQQSVKLNQALTGISDTMRTNRSSFSTADEDASSIINRAASAGPLNI